MIDQIRPSQLTAWLSTHPGAVVLDVREPWELETASVKADGFTLLCIPMNAIPARLAELNSEHPVACLCHHGGRSMQVANYLAHSGFSHVANIAGGINAWSSEVDSSVPRY